MSTTSNDERNSRRSRDTTGLILPPLTPATIQRAREGLAAARDRDAQSIAREALDNAEAIVKGSGERRISGLVRRLVLRSLIHTLFRVKVENPERIPTSAALLAPNHLSHFDPLLILSEVPASPYYYILGDARSLYNKWWKRQILSLSGGVIPLARIWKEEIAVLEGALSGRDDLAELASAIEQDVPDGSSLEALRQLDRITQSIFTRGDGIIIFPEGGLGSVEGSLRLPLKRGAVIYALRAGVPIVPVGIMGTQDLYFRKQLTLRFGEPLIFPRSPRPKPREVQAALDAVQDALMDLLAKDRRQPDEFKLGNYFLNHMLW